MAQSVLPLTTKPFLSRDEMNLAEFPLALLSTRSNPAVKTLEFRDTIRTSSGQIINREWIVTGTDKFGLPTASDDEILIGLLKLSVDQGLEDRKVYFTRYELLKTLRWSTEGRNYRRLQRALDRLSGVRIKATNAFYDNAAKAHSTVNFGIIDAYELNDARDARNGNGVPSFFLWSEVLFNSFKAGYIKKIDLSFYLGLNSSISKRLYRYFDKHFWYRQSIAVNVFVLAHEKLGISRNYKYLSSIRQQLDPALEELCEKGFLAGFRYEGKGRGAQLIVDSALRRTSISARKGRKKKKGEGKGGGNLRLEIEIMLEERGINPERLASVLDSYGEELLRKVKQIICYYDTLVEQNSRLVSKNRTGFLFRAVERARGFVLPGPFGSRGQVSIFPSQRRLTQSSDLGQANSYEDRGDCGEDDEVDRLRAQYLVERKREAKRLMSTAEPSILEKVRAEVERDLSKFRGNISESNFASVVDHGVEERLLKLFAFPGFDEWMLSRSAPRRS